MSKHNFRQYTALDSKYIRQVLYFSVFGEYVQTGYGRWYPLANTYVGLTRGGGAGIAHVGTVCANSRAKRTNINEYLHNDLVTAQV